MSGYSLGTQTLKRSLTGAKKGPIHNVSKSREYLPTFQFNKSYPWMVSVKDLLMAFKDPSERIKA